MYKRNGTPLLENGRLDQRTSALHRQKENTENEITNRTRSSIRSDGRRRFCPVRRAKILRGACAIRGAEILRHHEKHGGEWEGPVTVPEMPEMSGGKLMHASLRVTSRGHVLVHEFQEAGTPLDATKYDHPVTMLYVDGDQLTLIHYCDAGNRPRMTGKMSPDSKTVEFELKDISGSTEYHMHHSVFTVIDANHHTEDWTFMMKDKPIHAHFDLQRKN